MKQKTVFKPYVKTLRIGDTRPRNKSHKNRTVNIFDMEPVFDESWKFTQNSMSASLRMVEAYKRFSKQI